MRTLRLGVVAVLVTMLLLIIGLPVTLGALRMWRTIHPGCGAGNDTPAAYGLQYRDVAIPARWGGTYQGFYIAGVLSATIVVPPAYAGGKDGLLSEAAILAAHGYNVLTYESRACTRINVLSLGYREIDDVGDVLVYLKTNPDHLPVNLSHIALHGFSSAGATSTMAAARYPEVEALLTEGGYHTSSALTGLGTSSSWIEALMNIGANIAYRVGTGEDPANLDPIGAIPKLPPRPIFFVYGSDEPSLPGARLQLAAARAADPNTVAELWVVPGAGHGWYVTTVGRDEYVRWVLPFYDCALLKQNCDGWRALWPQK